MLRLQSEAVEKLRSDPARRKLDLPARPLGPLSDAISAWQRLFSQACSLILRFWTPFAQPPTLARRTLPLPAELSHQSHLGSSNFHIQRRRPPRPVPKPLCPPANEFLSIPQFLKDAAFSLHYNQS